MIKITCLIGFADCPGAVFGAIADAEGPAIGLEVLRAPGSDLPPVERTHMTTPATSATAAAKPAQPIRLERRTDPAPRSRVAPPYSPATGAVLAFEPDANLDAIG